MLEPENHRLFGFSIGTDILPAVKGTQLPLLAIAAPLPEGIKRRIIRRSQRVIVRSFNATERAVTKTTQPPRMLLAQRKELMAHTAPAPRRTQHRLCTVEH